MVSKKCHKRNVPFFCFPLSFFYNPDRFMLRAFFKHSRAFTTTRHHIHTMSVTDTTILDRLAQLQIAHPDVISHAPVKGAAEWKAELTLASANHATTPLTKTLLFKPKTAKSAVPTPVMVLAQENTETPSGAIGKFLELKELRLASEDLIKEVIPSAASKDDVSAFALPKPVPETLHLLLDAKLAKSEEQHAIHLTSSATTLLIKGSDIKAYLDNLVEGEGVKVIDFAELKASAPAPIEKKPAA